MKKLIKQSVILIINVYSKIFTYKLVQKWESLKNIIYTIWIRNYLTNVGTNVSFSIGLEIQGGGNNIEIGNNTNLGKNCILGCWKKYKGTYFNPSIKIGSNCNIGDYCHITAINKVTIGNGVLTGRYVYISDNNHGDTQYTTLTTPPINRKLDSKGPVIIKDNVWIGDKVTILSGITIGEGAIIASNAVVTKDIPPYCIAAGIPAKIIKNTRNNI